MQASSLSLSGKVSPSQPLEDPSTKTSHQVLPGITISSDLVCFGCLVKPKACLYFSDLSRSSRFFKGEKSNEHKKFN